MLRLFSRPVPPFAMPARRSAQFTKKLKMGSGAARGWRLDRDSSAAVRSRSANALPVRGSYSRKALLRCCALPHGHGAALAAAAALAALRSRLCMRWEGLHLCCRRA